MIKAIKKIIWNLLIRLRIGGAIQLMLTGALLDDGWFNSFNTKNAIDKDKNPIPWCTYSFIKFLVPRLKREFTVFEFGSGNSTLWYSKRVMEIISVENDEQWYKIISKKVPSNARVIYKPLQYDGEYCRMAQTTNKKFDIVIVDGRDRVRCAINSISTLTNEGVIIFDNSDLPQYAEGINYLISKGFKRLDFIGLSPVTPHNNYTSVFYRINNCLGI